MSATATKTEIPMAAMKWWGWGDEDVSFTHEDKPELAPFIREQLRLDVDQAAAPSGRTTFDELDVPEPVLPTTCAPRWRARSAPSTSPTDAARPRGPRARQEPARPGPPAPRRPRPRCPTSVVRPGDEAAVARSLQAALEADAVVIPFGGGSSISGSLEAPRGRDAHRALGRHGPHGPGAGRRRDVAAGARAGRRLRPATSSASSTSAAGPSATSPTASPTPRWAAGSPPARRACSPTATATSPT